jgi:hypothetical protein
MRSDDVGYCMLVVTRRAAELVNEKRLTSPDSESGEWRVMVPLHEVRVSWAYYRHPRTGADVVSVTRARIARRPFGLTRFLSYHQRTFREYKWTLIYLALFLGALNLVLMQLGVTGGILRPVLEWLGFGVAAVASVVAVPSDS